jgi:predicted Zn-dependent peptidase
MNNLKLLFHKTAILLFAVILMANISTAGDKHFIKNQNNLSGTDIKDLPKGISIYQLDNGLQILLIENPALPVIGLNAIVKTGSAFESFSTSGASHLLEHLLFNGTTLRTQKQLYDDVDRIGAYNNATTEDFFTDFMFVVPVENYKKGLEIQADMLFNSTIPIEKYQKEKGIVLEEISKSIADPNEQIERNTISILYNGHALSLPTLGTYSTVEAITRDEVFTFYKTNYVPNNIILTVIGNFKTAAILPVIKEIYGKAHPGQVLREVNPDWKTGFQSLSVDSIAAGTVFHRFYDGKEKVLQLFFQLPKDKTPEFFHLLDFILDKNKDSIQSSLKTEFKQVKTVNLSTRLSHLGNYLEAKVTSAADIDYDAVAKSISARISAITFKLPDEVVKTEAIKVRTESARNIEKPHMFGIYYSGTIVKNGIESLLNSFSGDGYFPAAKELETLKVPGLRFVIVQTPSGRDEEGRNNSLATTKYYNDTTTGKNLIVVQNEANNLLAIHYLVKHKAVYEAKYGKDASTILHDAIEQRLTSDEIKKTANKFGFTFTVNDNPFISMDDIYLHPDFGYIRVEGLADDVKGAIQFLDSQLKDFVPTKDEFNKAVEKYKGIGYALAGGDKAKKLFEETYKLVVYEPNPYALHPPVLTYESLLAFTKEYLKPSNIIISVVSPANPDTVDKAFDQFGFSKITDEPPVYTPVLQIPDKPVTIEKTSGGERSYLFWGFTKQINPEDNPALQALSLILSDQIVFDIREKQGLAYHMSAGIEVINDKALFYINQGTRPKNVDTLINQYSRFFKYSVIDSLTQDQLDKSINQYLGRIIFRRLSSINKAFYLGSSLYLNNDYEYDKKNLDALRKVTVADVKSVAQKYLNIVNPISIIVR